VTTNRAVDAARLTAADGDGDHRQWWQ
jgi:hypothetical protein